MMLRTIALSAAASVLATVLAGCVVEKPRPKTGLSIAPAARGGSVEKSLPAKLPDGPVASPANSPTSSARILVRVDRLATVAYDGQVLPQVSPDGRFIAVEEGEAPSWATMLAQPGATPALTTRIVVYDISRSPPEDKATVMDYPSPLPAGLVLGRSCDQRGFLVESPRPDGSRWIGRVSWVGGKLEWLVQGGAVNAHAVLTMRGELLFTRRAIESNRASLVLLAEGGESIRDDGSYLFPLTTSERDVVYVLSLQETGMDVEAVRLVEEPPGSGLFRLGRTFSRALIGKPGDPALAYQVTAPVQSALITGKPHDDSVAPTPLVLLHPDFQRMAVFDTQAAGFTLLSVKSIAAIKWSESPENGYLCATPLGLMYSPPKPAPGKPARADVRLDSTPYVPRATTDPARPVILLGPSTRDPQGKLWIRSLKTTDRPAE